MHIARRLKELCIGEAQGGNSARSPLERLLKEVLQVV